MNDSGGASDLLTVSALAKRYPGGAGVSNVSLSVAAGSITGFIGVNGAGKSTTLRCILGLTQADAGRIELFGRAADFKGRQAVGFLPEERGLAPRDRARDAIAFHARLKGMRRREAYVRADELLERIGLEGRRGDRVGELSKGNAQRVQILCAFAHRPRLLILDEPLSGLDPLAQAELGAWFAEHRAGGGAILFSTHAMAAAEQLCDRVVILSGGRTVFEGTVGEAGATAQHGVYVVSTDDAAVLAAVADVGGEAQALAAAPGAGGAVRWRVLLPESVSHPALMRALAERQAPIMDFTPVKPDLEAALWRHSREAPPAEAEAAVAAA